MSQCFRIGVPIFWNSPKRYRRLRACCPSAKAEGEKKDIPLLSLPSRPLIPRRPLDLWIPTLCMTKRQQPRRHGPPGVVTLTWAMPPMFLNLAVMHLYTWCYLCVPTLCMTRCQQLRRHGPLGVVVLAWTVHPYSQTLPCCTHGKGISLWLSVFDLALGDRDDGQ